MWLQAQHQQLAQRSASLRCSLPLTSLAESMLSILMNSYGCLHLLAMQSVSSLAHCSHNKGQYQCRKYKRGRRYRERQTILWLKTKMKLLAGDSGLQRDDTRAGEVDDQDQEAAEHMGLTIKMPAVTDAQFIELQDVSFAVALHLSYKYILY